MKLTTLETNILYSFTKDIHLETSILQLSKEMKIDYKNVYLGIKNLEKKSLIVLKKIGNSSICSVNFKALDLSINLAYAEEMKSQDIFLKKFPFLSNFAKEVKKISPVVCLGVFGSQASGKATSASDIDIFVLSQNEKDFKWFVNKHFPELEKTVDLTVINFEEFYLSLKSKEFTVSKEISKNKKILVGAELFYQIITEVENEKRN